MRLRLKANLVFAIVAVIGCGVMAGVLHHVDRQQRITEAGRTARLMLAQAEVAEHYTQAEVTPLLSGAYNSGAIFLPPSAGFYAVEVQGRLLSQALPGYWLRRVVLDPGGQDDRPDPAERAMIDALRADHELQSLTQMRPDGALSVALPIVMHTGVCATCYPSRAEAPAGIRDAFRGASGFDRKPGEIIGATIATVPVPKGSGVVLWGMVVCVVVVLALWIVMNVVFDLLVFAPLRRMTTIADAVSTGAPNVEEFETRSADEIGGLARSFNRLRRSMETAMAMLEQ